MLASKTCHLFFLLRIVFLFLKAESGDVPLTLLSNSTADGAVCLDGSPPGYHFEKGFGDGIRNWLVQMEGGGWCADLNACLNRTKNFRGSSVYMKSIGFSGILSNKKLLNPDFYNWNKIKVRYCDGSSFTGDVTAVDPKTKLHFRGNRVWHAVIDDLLRKGMDRAANAILSGCSAGGLAAILHCDKFRAKLPSSANVKCLSDAGYFIKGKDISGKLHVGEFFSNVVKLHNSTHSLPGSCTSKTNHPELCFFPQRVAKYMATPLFVLNSAVDYWQIKNILAPGAADRNGIWKPCKRNLTSCNASQLLQINSFKQHFLLALNITTAYSSKTNGFFINSCYAHCQSGTSATWLSPDSPQLNGTKIGKAVGDWFYNRGSISFIDTSTVPSKLATCADGDSDE